MFTKNIAQIVTTVQCLLNIGFIRLCFEYGSNVTFCVRILDHKNTLIYCKCTMFFYIHTRNLQHWRYNMQALFDSFSSTQIKKNIRFKCLAQLSSLFIAVLSLWSYEAYSRFGLLPSIHTFTVNLNINAQFFFYTRTGVYISVRKRYFFPPPSENYIFPPLATCCFSTPIVAFLP